MSGIWLQNILQSWELTGEKCDQGTALGWDQLLFRKMVTTEHKGILTKGRLEARTHQVGRVGPHSRLEDPSLGA